MSEATQTYLSINNDSEQTDNGFYGALNYLREERWDRV